MRLPRPWIPVIAGDLVKTLLERELVTLTAKREAVTQATAELMLEELSVEDRLNREVHDLLQKHEADIERGRLDYRALFDMTKKKLARERNLVL